VRRLAWMHHQDAGTRCWRCPLNAPILAASCHPAVRCPCANLLSKQVELPGPGLGFWSAPLILADPSSKRNTSNESVRCNWGQSLAGGSSPSSIVGVACSEAVPGIHGKLAPWLLHTERWYCFATCWQVGINSAGVAMSATESFTNSAAALRAGKFTCCRGPYNSAALVRCCLQEVDPFSCPASDLHSLQRLPLWPCEVPTPGTGPPTPACALSELVPSLLTS